MKLFLWRFIQCEVADNHVVFFGGCRNISRFLDLTFCYSYVRWTKTLVTGT